MMRLPLLLIALILSTPALAADVPPTKGACKADVEKLCPGIEPGGGRIMDCLQAHRSQLSPGCKANLRKWRVRHTAQGSGGQ